MTAGELAVLLAALLCAIGFPESQKSSPSRPPPTPS